MKILVTGGAGFVGAHIVEHFLKNTDWDIVVLDKLNYASNGFDRLRDINCFDEKRIKIFTYDLQHSISVGLLQEIGEVDYILNLASESHVDNSIKDPVSFIQNNVNLLLNMLECARQSKTLKRFIQFSTDEVYGTAPEGTDYTEGSRHNPGSPYSASKSAQEAICRAYANTYKLPINIISAMNIIGERQHPEKFVPLCIRRIINEEVITIHSNPDKTQAGKRHYLHARNVGQAIQFILDKTNENLDKEDASKGQWNVVGDIEIDNLTLAKKIGEILDREVKYEMVDFHSSRPGHDLRYALDGNKLKNAGFSYPKTFDETLKKVVEWHLMPENKRWINL
jgi:dTDP-glucose 4,6-dehydratase